MQSSYPPDARFKSSLRCLIYLFKSAISSVNSKMFCGSGAGTSANKIIACRAPISILAPTYSTNFINKIDYHKDRIEHSLNNKDPFKTIVFPFHINQKIMLLYRAMQIFIINKFLYSPVTN